MAINKIMCCCGSGLGSSMLVRMNVEEIVKKLGVKAEVSHSSLSDCNESSADLFVVGGDLASFVEHLPNKIILSNIMDKKELEAKLREKLGITE